MNIACVVRLGNDSDIEKELKNLVRLGLHSCQLISWDRKFYNSEKNAQKVKEVTAALNVQISAFWCGWEGPKFSNFFEGPMTMGLVPEAYRMERLISLKEGSFFAKDIGVSDLATHVGFLPEDPKDPKYAGTILALKELMKVCEVNQQYFLFETGLETPATLLRAMEDVGSEFLGVNLDPANLLRYGKANPIDAVEMFGSKIRGVHGKDGFYPTSGQEPGEEVRIGDGRVNYPLFLKKLQEVGYQGDITIEKEITAEKIRDILYTKQFLQGLLEKM